MAPVTTRVRAYFAPVNRAAGLPTLFDAAQLGRFDLDAPPAPWLDLGWVSRFARKSGTKVDALRAGLRVVEVETVMSHRETCRDIAGFVHRGKQFIDIAAALFRRAIP